MELSLQIPVGHGICFNLHSNGLLVTGCRFESENVFTIDVNDDNAFRVLKPGMEIALSIEGRTFHSGKIARMRHREGLLTLYCHVPSLSPMPSEPVNR